MEISATRLFRDVMRFGSGEFLARVFYIAIVILLGHLYGVVILGVYALAMTIGQYLVPVIDFGLRHIGARLVARYPGSASEIVLRVQRRRILMAAAALPLVLFYAVLARLSPDLKVFLFLFSAIGALYALSLDWAAWGREQMLLVGAGKAIVPGCVLLGLLISLGAGHLLTWLVVGNLIGFLLQGFVFWYWWRRHRHQISGPGQGAAEIAEAIRWGRAGVMGLAWLGNLAFNTTDMLVLGAFSNPRQVGLYSASYRILNQVLMAYYLLIGVLYPQLARQDGEQRRTMMRPLIFVLLAGSGTVLAVLIVLFRRPMLGIVFGHDFVAAAPLLLLLAFCIPMDFLVSYLSNAYFAWSMERSVLICAAVAAGVNITLNLATIPRYGAMAAAVNTLIAYIVYLGMLATVGRRLSSSTATGGFKLET
jgi:O-antigen/teichoic acid export membrane protein